MQQPTIEVCYSKKLTDEFARFGHKIFCKNYAFESIQAGINDLKKDHDITKCTFIISDLTSDTIAKILAVLQHNISEFIIGYSRQIKPEATLHINKFPPKKISFERFLDCLAFANQTPFDKIEFPAKNPVMIPDKHAAKDITPIEIAKILAKTDGNGIVSFSSAARAVVVVEKILSSTEFQSQSSGASIIFRELSFTLERTYQKTLLFNFSALTHLTLMEPSIQNVLSVNNGTSVQLNFPEGSEEQVKPIISFFRSSVYQRPLTITLDRKQSEEIDRQLKTIAQRNQSLDECKKSVTQYSQRQLSFSGLNFNDDDIRAMTHFTGNFHEIPGLSLTHISALPKNFFGAFKTQNKLASISIVKCQLDKSQVIELCEFISTSKTLETLSVKNCELDYNDFLERLSQSDSLPQLKSIDIRSDGNVLKFSLISPINLFAKLNHCKIIYNQTSQYSSGEIAFSSAEVDLSAYQLDSSELLEILTSLSNRKTLTKLNISNKKINKAILQALQSCVNQIPTLTTILMDGCECVEDISSELMTLFNHTQLPLISLNDFEYDFSSLSVKSQGNIPKNVTLNNKLFCDTALAFKTLKQTEQAKSEVSCNVRFDNLNFSSLFSSPKFKPIILRLLSSLLIIQNIGKIAFVMCQLSQESLRSILDNLRDLPLLSDIDLSNSTFAGDTNEQDLSTFILSKPKVCLSLKGTNLKTDIIFTSLSSVDYQSTATIETSNGHGNFYKLRELNEYILTPEKAKKLTLSNLDRRLLPRLGTVLSTASNLVEVDLSQHINSQELTAILELVAKNMNIRRLNFSYTNLSDDCMNILVDYLLSPSCKVTTLDLSRCKISSPGIHRLGDMISKNSSLITLTISNISSLEKDLDLIGIALSKNKTLIHLVALEELPKPYSNLQVGARTTADQKENVKHLRSRIARVGDFAYALKYGERRPPKLPNKPKPFKNTSLLQVDLFHTDILSVANKGESGIISELTEILNSNRSKADECFAELAKPNPNIDKIKDLLRKDNQTQISPYATNENEDTLLHVAVRKNQLEVIKAYFKIYTDWNIDIFIPNKANETALSLAQTCGGEILEVITNPDKTPIAVVAKQPATKKAKTADDASNPVNPLSDQPTSSTAAQKHNIPVTAVLPPTKKHSPDLSEAAPMDVQTDPLTELTQLIEFEAESPENLQSVKSLIDEFMLEELNRFFLLEKSICSKKLRITKLFLVFGLDINRKQSKDHCPLTIAAALNVRPIFELLLCHPMLSQDSVQDTLIYCKTHQQPFAGYYRNRCEIRLKESFLKPQNVQWVQGMPVVFGSKTPDKVVSISSQGIQHQLFFKNAFTQTILSKAEGIDKDKPDTGGNPVTCCLTFITSGATPNSRQSIQIPIDLPQKSFHVSMNAADSIALTDLREKMQSRAESGFEMVMDKSQFQQGQGKYRDPAQITDEDLLNDVWFKQCFHHGEQSMVSGLEEESVVTQIVEKIFASPQFVWGSKVYGLVLDVCSPRYVCSNCVLAILSLQNPSNSPFLKTLSEILESNGCRLPKLSPLKMITRVGSYRAFEKSEPVTLALHSKICLDMKLTANKIILQEDIVQTSESMTQFHSTNT